MTEKKFTIEDMKWVRHCEKRMTTIEGLLQRLGPQMSENEMVVLAEIYSQFEEDLIDLGVLNKETKEVEKNEIKPDEKLEPKHEDIHYPD